MDFALRCVIIEKKRFNAMKENIEDIVLELRDKGHSCSEATLTAISRALQLDYPEDMLRALSVGFRGGIGGTFDEGTCGALSGAIMAMGLADPSDPALTVKRAKKSFESFKREFGTVECGAMHHKGRGHCNNCCLSAAREAMRNLDKDSSGI